MPFEGAKATYNLSYKTSILPIDAIHITNRAKNYLITAMSKIESNNPGPAPASSPSDIIVCYERFPGFACFGYNLPKRASHLMEIINGPGTEGEDRIGQIDSTMDLFMELLVELELQVKKAFKPVPFVIRDRRIDIIVSVSKKYLLNFLRSPESRTDWHHEQWEEVPRRWRVRSVVGNLITLLDITTGLLGTGGAVTAPQSIEICEDIRRRYRYHYSSEEPDLIKVALSKLMFCAQYQNLDRSLEDIYDIMIQDRDYDIYWQREMSPNQTPTPYRLREDYWLGSYEQSHDNSPREARFYRSAQESWVDRAMEEARQRKSGSPEREMDINDD